MTLFVYQRPLADIFHAVAPPRRPPIWKRPVLLNRKLAVICDDRPAHNREDAGLHTQLAISRAPGLFSDSGLLLRGQRDDEDKSQGHW